MALARRYLSSVGSTHRGDWAVVFRHDIIHVGNWYLPCDSHKTKRVTRLAVHNGCFSLKTTESQDYRAASLKTTVVLKLAATDPHHDIIWFELV